MSFHSATINTCLFWISMVCCAFLGYRLSSSLWLAFPHVFWCSLSPDEILLFLLYTLIFAPTCDCFMKLFASSVNTHHFIYVTTNSHWKLLPIGKFFRLFALLVKSLIYLHIKYFKNILIQRKWNFLNTCIFGNLFLFHFCLCFLIMDVQLWQNQKEKLFKLRVLRFIACENQSFHITGVSYMRKIALSSFHHPGFLLLSCIFFICRVRVLWPFWEWNGSLGGRYKCFPCHFPICT